MSNPPSVAVPPVLVMSPVSILKVVVLPAPLTPSKPKHSPAGMTRLMPLTASFLPLHWARYGNSVAPTSLYSYYYNNIALKTEIVQLPPSLPPSLSLSYLDQVLYHNGITGWVIHWEDLRSLTGHILVFLLTTISKSISVLRSISALLQV